MIIWRCLCKKNTPPVRQLSSRRQLSQLATDDRRARVAHLLETRSSDQGTLEVSVGGFIRSIRKQKQVAFVSLGDGSSITPLQVVLRPDQTKELSIGCAVVIRGKWTRSLGDRKQAHELIADQINVQGENDASTYPIQKKFHTPDFLRTLPHLRVRTPHSALLLRLRSQIIADATLFFAERGYIQTHPPLITSSDCEGAGEVFTVESEQSVSQAGVFPQFPRHGPFFGSQKYLTVSAQLHLEALAQSVGKVWTLSPTFRAERSDTSRHLSEFYMLEAEMAFTNGLGEIMDVVEDLVRHLASRLKESRIGNELLQERCISVKDSNERTKVSQMDIGQRWESLLKDPWPRVTYRNVCTQLEKAVADHRTVFDVPPDFAGGLHTEHEKFIAEELFKGPVFVTDYPRRLKPFYMAPSPVAAEDGQVIPTVSCFDLLLPEMCEVAGGSIREHRFAPLQKIMQQQGMLDTNASKETRYGNESNAEVGNTLKTTDANMDWYLDLRRYGSVPHGGFGLGFDRLLGFLAGVSSIRDVVTFPRHYKRCLT